MDIKNVESQLTWMVECDGLSYVRTLYIRNNKQFIAWKRNFDWTPEKDKSILSESELEKRFSEINILEATPIYSEEVK